MDGVYNINPPQMPNRYLLLPLLLLLCPIQSLFPTPKWVNLDPSSSLALTPCSLILQPSSSLGFDPGYYFTKVLRREFGEQLDLECQSLERLPIVLELDERLAKERYQIRVQQKTIQLRFSTQRGYVYAMETLFQMVEKGSLPIGEVDDEPLVEYRGIMLDSVRHFLSTKAIKRTIEAMPLSKLNYLHWHIVDDQAFPLPSASHPELSEGAYDSVSKYSADEIKQIIGVAAKNGVNIIPQVDTPSHTRSWGLSGRWKPQNITIKCSGYHYQFDVSKQEVYELVGEVLRDVDALFGDSDYIHLGGDEVSNPCWDLVPAIKTFMAERNISNYGELQMYWRKQLRKNLAPTRKVLFWKNANGNVSVGDDEVLHYWGAQSATADFVKSSSSKIVLSPSDFLYLNAGQGFTTGDPYGHFSSWRMIYENFTVFPAGVDRTRILGAEAPLWGEVCNEEALDSQLWLRASAFAERVWSEKKLATADITKKLVDLGKQLNRIGVGTSPILNEFCEVYPNKCFGG